jgi:uncharacterized glyoxalase superfamily protein PhnB
LLTVTIELAYLQTPGNHESISIQIRVNDLDEVMNKLRGNVDFSEPEERPWGSKYLYLTDPSGIQVIVYEGKI